MHKIRAILILIVALVATLSATASPREVIAINDDWRLFFAEDSDSELGKIRSASQGQFSVSDRDSNTPHIKVVRVVTTVNYTLQD